MTDDLNRWLSSVRPTTAADDAGWATSTSADAALAEVHRRTARRARLTRRARFVVIPGAAFGAAVAVAVLATGGTPEVRPGGSAVLAAPAMRPAARLLTPFTSCADLLSGLRTHTAAAVGAYGLPGTYPTYSRGPTAPTVGSVPAPTLDAATSTTNVREPGVDEPDIVKTDGDRVITINQGTLRVLSGMSRRITGSLDLTLYDGWQNATLLVAGDHALVTLNGNDYYRTAGFGSYRNPTSTSAKSSYLFVDLAGTPHVTGMLRASGSYLDARLVGSTIRLVVTNAPTIAFPSQGGIAANRAAVQAAPVSAWQPVYSITSGASTRSGAVPCDRISHPTSYTGASLLTIYTLDIDALATDPDPVSIAADGDSVYATASSLYVASNPSWYCCNSPSTQQTEIHRFDIRGTARPTYLGSASVAGRLLSQYSISDSQGQLRLAVTGLGAAKTQSSSVIVLNADTLTVTGRVDGLGRGEQIYAVRFIGDTAYVVTFRQTDPLYVVDLRNPAAPRVTGRLSLTGYSDYLHDVGDGRLVGVGQEVSNQRRLAGLQVSLFDVTNPAAPQRTAQVVRTDVLDEQATDPHAFLYWAPTGLVAVPANGKVLVLRVSGSALTVVGLVSDPGSTGYVLRSLIVDGALWTVSDDGVQVNDEATLARQAFVRFS